MINILAVGLTQNYGGTEAFLLNYASRLNGPRLHVDFLSQAGSLPYADKVSALGSRVFFVPKRTSDPLHFGSRVDAFFREHATDYDVIWDNCCQLTNLTFLAEAKRHGIPHRVMHGHNSRPMGGRAHQLMHAANRRRVLSVATDCWSCSDEATAWFYGRPGNQLPGYAVIPDAVDFSSLAFSPTAREEVRSSLGLTDEIVIGNVGRLTAQKNQSFLLEMLKELRYADPGTPFRLLLVGQGEDEPALRGLAESLGVSDAVSFLGARGDVDRLYQAMDIFAFPSLFEGFGMAPLEAQVSGLLSLVSTACAPGVSLGASCAWLDVEEGPAAWARALLGTRPYRRIEQDSSVLDASPYNLDHAAALLAERFEAMVASDGGERR